jgi:tetratricopeptide (TPR) repeat protein
MAMLAQMANVGEAAAKQQGPAHEQAFKNLRAQLDQQQKEASAKSAPNPQGPTVEDALGPFFKQIMGLGSASMGALGAMAEADLAKQRGSGTKDEPTSLLGKAALLSLSAKHEEAVTLYRQMIEEQPENATAFFGLASELARLKKNDESIAALAKAVMLDGKYSERASRDPAFDGIREDSRFKRIADHK